MSSGPNGTPTVRLPGGVRVRHAVVMGLFGLDKSAVVHLTGWLILVGALLNASVAVDAWWFDIGVLLVLVLIGYFLRDVSSERSYRAAFGRPVFEPYGGVPERVLRATITCAPDFVLRVEDAERLRAAVTASRNFEVAVVRDRYLEQQDATAAPHEDEWDEYWERASSRLIGGSSYGRTVEVHPEAFAVVPGVLYRTKLLLPFGLILAAVLVFLSPFFRGSWSPPPFLLALSLGFGLVSALAAAAIVNLYQDEPLNVARPPGYAAWIDRLVHLPEQDRDALKAEAEDLEGPPLRVTTVRMGRRCRRAIDRFTARQFAVVMGVNLGSAFLAMGLFAMLAAPFAEDVSALAKGYAVQVVVLTEAAVAAIGAFLFWSLLISRLAEGLRAVIGTLCGALVVPVWQYLSTGHFVFDLRIALGSALTAAIGFAGSVAAELVERPPQS
jgi:hypothetical protein